MNKAHYEIIIEREDGYTYSFMVECDKGTLIPEIISGCYKLGLYRDIKDIDIQSIWSRKDSSIIDKHIQNGTIYNI